MSSSKVQWLIRDEKGKLTGPLSTEEVLGQIRLGMIGGGESVSLHPGGQWIPISHETTFFDALIASLEAEMAPDPQSLESSQSLFPQNPLPSSGSHQGSQNPKKFGDSPTVSQFNDDQNSAHEPRVPKNSSIGKESGESPNLVSENGGPFGEESTKKISGASVNDSDSEPMAFEVQRPKGPRESSRKKKNPFSKVSMGQAVPVTEEVVSGSLPLPGSKPKKEPVKINPESSTDDPSSTPLVEKQRRERARRRQQNLKNEKLRRKRGQLRRLSLVIIVALLGGIFYLLLEEQEEPVANIFEGPQHHLLRPRFGKKTEKLKPKQFIKKGKAHFTEGTIKSYLKAQKYLVPVVQVSKDPEPFLYLCLVYKELWDFSYRDSTDHDTLVSVVRRVQQIAPQGRPARLCNLTLMIANGEYDKALKYTEVILSQDPSSVYYNMIAGEIHLQKNDPAVALFYFNRSAESWGKGPIWSHLFLKTAEAFLLRQQPQKAIEQIDGLLRVYPRHATGLVERGVLEYAVFENILRAGDLIRAGLEQKSPLSNRLKSEAYYVLAEMARKQGDFSRALRYGKISFLTNSTNPKARELILSLGGIRALGDIKVDNRNLVYVGEQLMKRGLYSEAQAEYRAAFDANPRNGFAALRAAEALWKLNQGKDAIEWARKAVHVDPKFIRGFAVLADFLSQRYDFENAIGALRQAARLKRDHPDVWRGLALVEFRRRNYPMAVTFADRALKIYPSETETLIVKAKSLLHMEDFNKARQVIETAAEFDSSDEAIQGVFAEIITGQQGPNAGEAYLEVLISRRPKTVLFRRLLGTIMAREQKYDEAIEVLREALIIDPENKPTLLAMGKVLQQTGEKVDLEVARNYFLDAATIDPTDAEPVFLLGQLYLQSDQFLEAQEQFKRVLQINDRYPLGYFFSGKALVGMGDLTKALSMVKKEKEINPMVPEPYILGGEIFYRKAISTGEKESLLGSSNATQCVEEYRGAIARDAKTSDVYTSLARCYRLLGDFDSAEGMLDEAKALESGNSQIYRELGAIYEVQGKVDAAIEAYEKYLRLSPKAKDASQVQLRVKQLERSGQEEP